MSIAIGARARRVGVRVAHATQLASAKKTVASALSLAMASPATQRLYVVRRLSLGRINGTAHSRRLSSRIEDDVRQMQAGAVPGMCSDAPHANAVFFEDAVSACVALALRLLAGARTDAWFWSLAVRRYRPHMTRDEALRATLFNVLDADVPQLAVAAFVAALCEQQRILPLLEILRRADIAQVQARCGWQPLKADAAAVPSVHGGDAQVAALHRPYAQALRAALQAWSADTDLKVWLAAALLIAGAPQRAAAADLSLQALQWIAHIENSREYTAREDPITEDGSGVDRHAAAGAQTAVPRVTIVRAANADLRIKPRHMGESAAPRNARQGLAPVDDGRHASDNAGLLFLINAATRLELPQWLATHGDWAAWGLAPRLFQCLAERMNISLADPIIATLPAAEPEQPEPDSFIVPAAWQVLVGASRIERRATTRDAAQVIAVLSGRLPLAGWRGDTGCVHCEPYPMPPVSSQARHRCGSLQSALIGAWITAMRLWCRRYCGMGLSGVVRRAGHVAGSATHVDVSFDLNAADLRLRRAGLDLDPGWVAWLGRIVNFHYGGERR